MDFLIGFVFISLYSGELLDATVTVTATDSLCYIRFVIDAVGYELNAS